MPETADISDIVVNAAMNRGRGFSGVNSYTRDLRQFDIAAFLRERLQTYPSQTIRWLDVCCGEGRALTEAAQIWAGTDWGKQIEIIGLDLWDDLPVSQASSDGPSLRFVAADAAFWSPNTSFDLITCVHGLHYLPDKLGFLERAYSWLAPNGGVLLAHLDKANVLQQDNKTANLWPILHRRARQQGIALRLTNHLLRMERTAEGPDNLSFGVTFVDRTVSPRPNFSGMTVIDSWYRREKTP
ncbi:MAG: class I SAM-dependent methyltransferase [Armatimonadota bacterium]